MINKLYRYARTARQVLGGFTLIETMVAVFLLSVAIAGPLTLASRGLSSALIAKDQVGAYYLGQDAIEFVRFVRDTNRLSNGNWITGAGGGATVLDLTPCVSTDGSASCYIDTIQSTVGAWASCPTASCILNYDTTGTPAHNYFSYTTGSPSAERYIRTIKIITPIGSNSNEATVIVTVQWAGSNGVTHAVTFHEDLFNWE